MTEQTLATISDGRSAGSRAGWWRWRRWLSVTAAAGLAVGSLVASPAQAQTVLCAGSFTNTVINGTVEVPPGQACSLNNVMVLGNAIVGAGADLLMDQTVVGKVIADNDAFVYGDGLVAAQGIDLDHSFGTWLQNSVVFGGAEVTGSTGTILLSEGTNYIGDIRSVGGWTLLRDGRVNGVVDSRRDQAATLARMTVAGGVSVLQSVDGALLCDLTNGGETSVRSSGGQIQIGGPYPTPSCSGNTFAGDVQVHDNKASDIQISANIVFGDVACTGNTPAPVGFGNIILGTASGQCAQLGTANGGALIPPVDARGAVEATTEAEQAGVIEELVGKRFEAARDRLG